MFGAIQEPNHTLADLIELYKKPAFIAYFSVLESFILFGMIATHYLEYRYNKYEETGLPPDSKIGSFISLSDLKSYIGVRYLLDYRSNIMRRG